MNESSYERQLASFAVAMRESAVTRILELGTEDESFLASVVREADWADSIELHCADNGDDSFDSKLTTLAETLRSTLTSLSTLVRRQRLATLLCK